VDTELGGYAPPSSVSRGDYTGGRHPSGARSGQRAIQVGGIVPVGDPGGQAWGSAEGCCPHVEYAERGKEYRILFIFSPLCDYRLDMGSFRVNP